MSALLWRVTIPFVDKYKAPYYEQDYSVLLEISLVWYDGLGGHCFTESTVPPKCYALTWNWCCYLEMTHQPAKMDGDGRRKIELHDMTKTKTLIHVYQISGLYIWQCYQFPIHMEPQTPYSNFLWTLCCGHYVAKQS